MYVSRQQEGRIMRLLLFIVPFAGINMVMLNLALPQIVAEFGISTSTGGWIITLSGILSALGSLIYGKLADHIGVKNLATFGISFFAVGSVICFFAGTFPLLLAGRVIQGIGVSVIPTLAILVPVRYIAEERRGKAQGIVASILALAGIAGPIVGGVVSGLLHWRFLFLFSVAIVLALPFVRKWLPDHAEQVKRSYNMAGAGLLAASVVLLMEAVLLWKWWFLVGSAGLWLLFFLQQKRSTAPFIPVGLFSSASYRYGLLMGIVNTVTYFGVFLITPLMLNRVYGLETHWIGLLLLPGAIVSAMLGKYGGTLIDRRGPRYLFILSIPLLAAGYLLLSSLAGQSYWIVSLFLIFAEVGYIFMQPAISNWVSKQVPAAHSGIGMGVYSLSNFLSIAISGAVFTKLVEQPALLSLNPIAPSWQASPYSTIYFGCFLLTLINLIVALVYPQRKADQQARAASP